MKLMDYIRTDGKPNGRQEWLADRLKSSPAYVYQIAKWQMDPSAKGGRRPSPEVAKQIEKETAGLVRREALIWPEDYD